MSSVHEIIVVSDLHLGRGKNPETERYFRLETFFFDDDFMHFCNYLIDDARNRQARLKLVLNGDTFDLMRLDYEIAEGASSRERRYGPALTPAVATEMVRQILAGHPVFVQALAAVLSAGHQIVMLPGNHDLELQWESVQGAVREAVNEVLADKSGSEQASDAIERLSFEAWFHYEEGRIWIEHGGQYDPENAFRFPLRRRLADLPEAVHKAEIDVPLGTFFQRYLYNRFGNITFIVPVARANFRYLRWLILNRPRLLARLVTVHAPFFWQVIRRLAKSGTSSDELRDCHLEELNELATRSGLGDALHKIDDLKRSQGSSTLLAQQLAIRSVKIAGFALLGALLVIALWTLGLSSIGTTELGFGLKAVLFLAFNFLFLVGAAFIVLYFLLRPAKEGPDPWLPPTAKRLAELLDVPIVTFGHTHDEQIQVFDRGGQRSRYYNTGTWIAVFTADAILPRERVQYTFLRVRGTQGQLLHWRPDRRESVPVVLIEDEPHAWPTT